MLRALALVRRIQLKSLPAPEACMRVSRVQLSILICVVLILGACTKEVRLDRAASPPCQPGQVNLNTATRDQLIALPEIGEVMANRILDYRKKSGPFAQITDVLVIHGMSEKRFRKIENLICAEIPPRKEGSP